MSDVGCVLDAKSLLGEDPLWDPRARVLHWVDIKRREIHRFDPASGRDEQWSTPEDVASLAVRAKGGLVMAMKSGFHFFDPVTTKFSNRRVFVEVSPSEGDPDGATCGVLVAHWGGWRVTRYDPKGRVDRVVKMPVQKPTCPLFGGPRRDILYVTSASIQLTPDELQQQPQADSLFAFEPGVKGLPEAHFTG